MAFKLCIKIDLEIRVSLSKRRNGYDMFSYAMNGFQTAQVKVGSVTMCDNTYPRIIHLTIYSCACLADESALE